MANNQPHSSLFVVPSDTINIPQPGILTSGTQNSTSGTAVLTDASQDFTTSVTNANGSASATFQFNFGNPAFSISSGNADANGYGNFEYAPPSGYFAWCTKNLAENG